MASRLHPVVKLGLDFAPLLVFFVAFRLGGVMEATLALMVATVVSIAIIYLFERKVTLAPLISGVLVTVLGGLSIALNNEQFIKLKPTLVNLVFSATLLIGVYGFRKGLLRYILDIAFRLTEDGWIILSRRWGFFFAFLAGLNEFVWRNYPTDFWVNFKVFGMFTLTVIFAAAQVRLVSRYAEEIDKADTD